MSSLAFGMCCCVPCGEALETADPLLATWDIELAGFLSTFSFWNANHTGLTLHTAAPPNYYYSKLVGARRLVLVLTTTTGTGQIWDTDPSTSIFLCGRWSIVCGTPSGSWTNAITNCSTFVPQDPDISGGHVVTVVQH